MTLKHTLVLVAVGALLIALGYSAAAFTPKAHSQVVASSTEPVLSDRQHVWLDALIWCESRANPAAINQKDRDGTPSYGYLQFKPGTFTLFEKEYGLTGTLMSSTTQKLIVEHMILDKSITPNDWANQQFPACVHLLGTPPSS